MNTEWITHRMPTKDDAVDEYILIWSGGGIRVRQYQEVWDGTPWQPIHRPAPYVKPKRWTVEWGGNNADFFTLYDSGEFSYYLPMLFREHAEAAQRIADIYNEVIP